MHPFLTGTSAPQPSNRIIHRKFIRRGLSQPTQSRVSVYRPNQIGLGESSLKYGYGWRDPIPITPWRGSRCIPSTNCHLQQTPPRILITSVARVVHVNFRWRWTRSDLFSCCLWQVATWQTSREIRWARTLTSQLCCWCLLTFTVTMRHVAACCTSSRLLAIDVRHPEGAGKVPFIE